MKDNARLIIRKASCIDIRRLIPRNIAPNGTEAAKNHLIFEAISLVRLIPRIRKWIPVRLSAITAQCVVLQEDKIEMFLKVIMPRESMNVKLLSVHSKFELQSSVTSKVLLQVSNLHLHHVIRKSNLLSVSYSLVRGTTSSRRTYCGWFYVTQSIAYELFSQKTPVALKILMSTNMSCITVNGATFPWPRFLKTLLMSLSRTLIFFKNCFCLASFLVTPF